MSKIPYQLYYSKVRDPFFNLALENHLLLQMQGSPRVLLMWCNDPCVVLGRFQNPWIECNLSKMSRDKVVLVRRQSGGGTVYHDNKNVNFSFLADKSEHSKKWNHKIVTQALSNLGVKAFSTDRGDIRLKEELERKISGSAFKEKKDVAFHHGTMLVESDLEKLNLYIHSNKEGLRTKSISSIRSTVANIKESVDSIDPETFIDQLGKCFLSEYSGNGQKEVIIDKDCELYNQILSSDYYSKLKQISWILKETPKFFVEEVTENFTISLTIKKSFIETIDIQNNDVHPDFLKKIEESLIYESILNIGEAFNSLEADYLNVYKDELSLMKSWFNQFFELDALDLF